MATTAISIKFRDIEGKEVTEVLFFDSGDVGTVALAQAQLAKYETLLEAVSGLPIVEANVTFGLTVDTGQSPDAGYSVRAGARLSFLNSDTVSDSLYVPGFLQGKMSNDIVNDADAQVLALINAIKGDGADGEEPLSTRGSGALWATYRGGKGTSRKVK